MAEHHALIDRIDESVKQLFRTAWQIARRHQSGSLCDYHVVMAILEADNGEALDMLWRSVGDEPDSYFRIVDRGDADIAAMAASATSSNRAGKRLLRDAISQAMEESASRVTPTHVLLSILRQAQPGSVVWRWLVENGVTWQAASAARE